MSCHSAHVALVNIKDDAVVGAETNGHDVVLVVVVGFQRVDQRRMMGNRQSQQLSIPVAESAADPVSRMVSWLAWLPMPLEMAVGIVSCHSAFHPVPAF